MNRGAEKHKILMKTVPSCSISVLKNMAIFGRQKMVRSRLSFTALKSTTTDDFFSVRRVQLFPLGDAPQFPFHGCKNMSVQL